MKRLYPDMPDVSPTEANRAIRIVERHLRTQRVSRARDLPEEARIRLYRDLRLFFDGNGQYPQSGSGKQGFSLRGFFSRLWEKVEDFLSACGSRPPRERGVLIARPKWESARMRA